MEKTKTKTNPLIFVGIGCLVLIVLISIGNAVVGKFFAKKIVQGVIENKTGIDVSEADAGNVTFTDSKTGAKVDIGSGKVPDAFPKDFPLYPGAKVTSAMSGTESGSGSGFWLTMTTADSTDKVAAYYTSQFPGGGWTINTTYTAGSTASQTVEKGLWNGSLAVSEDEDSKETQIVIVLSEKPAGE